MFILCAPLWQFTKKRRKKPTGKTVVIKKRAPVVTPDPVREKWRGGRNRDEPSGDSEEIWILSRKPPRGGEGKQIAEEIVSGTESSKDRT